MIEYITISLNLNEAIFEPTEKKSNCTGYTQEEPQSGKSWFSSIPHSEWGASN